MDQIIFSSIVQYAEKELPYVLPFSCLVTYDLYVHPKAKQMFKFLKSEGFMVERVKDQVFDEGVTSFLEKSVLGLRAQFLEGRKQKLLKSCTNRYKDISFINQKVLPCLFSFGNVCEKMMSRKIARLSYPDMLGLKSMNSKGHKVTSNYLELNMYSLPLWMNHMIKDYGFKSKILTIFCDNLSAKNISKNPIQRPRIKHNDIRHHFIRDFIEQKIISLEP